MGAHKKIGISKEQRDIGSKYARRFRLHDYKMVLSRSSGNRIIYLIGTDKNDITYRIRFDKVKKMRSPKGIQVVNRKDYLLFQSEQVHGKDRYDFSLVQEDDITFNNKLNILCNVDGHGLFRKRKAALITQREGCPLCSKNRFNKNRKYE